MTKKAERGTKRTCQACGARFYDLNREEIVCPMCQEPYVLEAATPPEAAAAAAEGANEAVAQTAAAAAPPPVAEPAFEKSLPDDPVVAEAEEADELIELAAVADEDIDAGDDADVLVETDDEGDADVTVIVGGPIPTKEDDET